jgi:SAM-dependent methyltransferase
MDQMNIVNNLVSPKTGELLIQREGYFSSADEKERFAVEDGIIWLLDAALLDKDKAYEKSLFDSIKIQNVSYVRRVFLNDAFRRISPFFKDKKTLRIAEMGGGEGHWAGYIKNNLPFADVFVCDLSHKALQRAPKTLNLVCADITCPIFARKSMDLICFWVSLHHLDPASRREALRQASEALIDGGILLVFEPNKKFFLRQIVYKSRLSKDVYPHEREQALDFNELSGDAKRFGLEKNGVYFLNPPYNLRFVRKLKKWILYFAAVEFLYRMDKYILDPLLGNIFSLKERPSRMRSSLYGFAVYQKMRQAAGA